MGLICETFVLKYYSCIYIFHVISSYKIRARSSKALASNLNITGLSSRGYTCCRDGFFKVLYILQANTIIVF
jgi:hypothetical protein